MSPHDRQQRILTFVTQYHRQRRQAPTVGEIIRGSGVNSYDDVAHDLDALIRQGDLAYVPGVGEAGFTTRRVRPTGAGGPAAAAPSPQRHRRAPPSSAPGRAPAAPGGHVQQPLPQSPGWPGGFGQPAAGAMPLGPLPAWLRRPSAVLALVAVGVAGGLLLAARAEPIGALGVSRIMLGPLSLPTGAVAVVAVAGALGAAIGRAAERSPWSWRALAHVVTLSAAAGAAAVVWTWVRPYLASFDETGIPSVIDGVAMLPALLPAARVPLPGAATLGLWIGRLVYLAGTVVGAPALALLQVPLMVAPAELWLIAAGRRRDRRVMILAGVLIGLGALGAAYLTAPGAYPQSAWPAEVVKHMLGGAVAGWAVTLRRPGPVAPGATAPTPRGFSP